MTQQHVYSMCTISWAKSKYSNLLKYAWWITSPRLFQFQYNWTFIEIIVVIKDTGIIKLENDKEVKIMYANITVLMGEIQELLPH